MLKAARKGLLVLGLNPKEIAHLREGQPVLVSLDDVGIPGQRVMLFMGEDDASMKRRFELSGLAEPQKGLIDLSKVKL